MDNSVNYNILFESNASKINAGVERLEHTLGDISKGSKRMADSFGDAMGKMGKKLSMIQIDSFVNNISHAADGLSALAEPGLKLSSSLAELSAITGTTGQKLKEIEGYARENAKTFGGDAAAGVESYKVVLSKLSPELAKQPKALKEMGNSISVLSKAMGGDNVAAANVLTTAMNQYGVSTEDPIAASKEMARMMNVMSAAANEGSAELPEQQAALEQAGMAAKIAGVSFEETAAAIQILDKAGKVGSEGGVALRNTLSQLSKGKYIPPRYQAELERLGVDTEALGNKNLTLAERLKILKPAMSDSALLTAWLGEGADLATKALMQQIPELERLTGAITGTNAAYEFAGVVMDTQAAKNDKLKARVDDFKISMYNATGGALGYASVLGQVAFDVANLTPVFVGASNAVSWLSDAKNRQLIIDKAMLVMNKAQIVAKYAVAAATGVWTAAQWALNVAMDANPIGIIIIAIAALAAGIAWVVSKTEGWGEAWQHTVTGAQLLWQGFVGFAELAFLNFINSIMIGINYIKKGWYEFKDALGMGDSAENKAIIAKIDADTAKRKAETAAKAAEVKKTLSAATDEFSAAVGSVHLKGEAEAGGVSTAMNSVNYQTAPVQGPAENGAAAHWQNPMMIAPPETPGAETANGQPTKEKADKTKTNTAIATGGTKNTNITISFKELIGILNIKGNDFKDSAKQMEQQASDGLVRVLAMATTAAS